jgi:hypothetical protein
LKGGRVGLGSSRVHPQEDQTPGHFGLNAHAMVHRRMAVLEVPEEWRIQSAIMARVWCRL